MRGVSALYNNLFEMVKNSVKNKNGLGHYPEQCELINEFGTKYAAWRHFKEHKQEITDAKKYKRKQEVKVRVQNTVDDIILQEDEYKKSSAKIEPQDYDITSSKIDERELYKLDKLSLDESHKV